MHDMKEEAPDHHQTSCRSRAYPMGTVRQEPTVANSWPCFTVLILTAVALHYRASQLSVLALRHRPQSAFLILGWLYGRWPRTTRLLVRGFISGLFGYRRRVIKALRRLGGAAEGEVPHHSP